jgi:hypothetical protein
MAKAYVDPNAKCCIEESRSRMTDQDFKEAYPGIGPCSKTESSPKGSFSNFLKNKKKTDADVAAPNASVFITRSGSSLIYTCPAHANYVRRRGATMERFLQYLRPSLNAGESGKVGYRFAQRADARKEKAEAGIRGMLESQAKEELNDKQRLSPERVKSREEKETLGQFLQRHREKHQQLLEEATSRKQSEGPEVQIGMDEDAPEVDDSSRPVFNAGEGEAAQPTPAPKQRRVVKQDEATPSAPEAPTPTAPKQRRVIKQDSGAIDWEDPSNW